MLKTNVYDMNGKQVGEVELSEAVFGIEPNESVVHDVVKNHLANCRQGTQSALTRAEVSGGGKKPWKQKGTGHARQGSTRAPQWTHGGIVFAPKPRDYSYTLNKKVRRLALKSVLSAKAQSADIVVIDEIKMDEIKTKKFAGFLSAVNADCKARVVTAEANENVAFDRLGGDCTSFVSQCLLAGGAPEDLTPLWGWYYRSGNDKAPAWSGVEPFWRFFTRSDREDGLRGVECGPEDLQPGDIIQLSFDGRRYAHCLLVVGTGRQILVCAHDEDSDFRPLSTYERQKTRFLHWMLPFSSALPSASGE